MNERKLIIIHAMVVKLKKEMTTNNIETSMENTQKIIDCIEKLIANDTET